MRNVTSSTHGCSLVRLLACDGAREYNIDISDLHDTGRSISGCGVILGVGSDTFAPVRNHTADEFFNITVRNLTTCAQEALRICEPCKNILIENVSTFGTPLIGMTYSKNFHAENFVIRNFNFCTNETETDSLITAISMTSPSKTALPIPAGQTSATIYNHFFNKKFHSYLAHDGSQ